MALDWIVDWIVNQIMQFVFYLADGFPTVDTISATTLSSSDGSDDNSNESDDDDDEGHSNDDGNFCVVDGAEGTKSTEILPENKDESTL